jgi:antitoxin component YwqK of YwqJK toxin-antitoxin module
MLLKQSIVLFISVLIGLTSCQSDTEIIETTNEFGRKIRYERKKSDFAKHGKYESFGENGVLTEETYYENDTLHGTRKYFYSNGKVESEEQFAHGLHHGPYRKYFESGRLEIQQEFINDAMEGMSIRYYPNGQKMEEVMIVHNDENGPFKEYYDNGVLKTEGNYIFIDDTAAEQGELKEYDSTGVLVRIADCEQGVCRTQWRKE